MSERYRVIPLTPMRRVIAARMVAAKRTIPHFRLVRDITIDAVMALRNELTVADSPPLSLTDLLIKACATALMDVPGVNVQWVEKTIHQYLTADISLVIAVDGGLSTPVVWNANSKSVWEIASNVKDLRTRAASNDLKMEEILGGSFSLSNLGMFGVDQFDAIINSPQCAILAVGAATPRVLATSYRGTRTSHVMTATLSCDHRAIDGVTGARFLAALRQRLEQPEHLRAGATVASDD